LAVANVNELLTGPASTFDAPRVNFTVTSVPGLDVIVIVAAVAESAQQAGIIQARRLVIFISKELPESRGNSDKKIVFGEARRCVQQNWLAEEIRGSG
jgi:hypothetical protein